MEEIVWEEHIFGFRSQFAMKNHIRLMEPEMTRDALCSVYWGAKGNEEKVRKKDFFRQVEGQIK